MTSISHVLCAVDFSDGARSAVAQAAALARAYGAGLTVLHVFVSRPVMDLPPLPFAEADRQRLTEALRGFAQAVAPDLRPDLRVREAESASEGIVKAVEDIDPDVLVMGTHGRSGFRRLFLGSVTEKVIRSAPCATLVAPAQARAAFHGPEQFRKIVCAVDLSDSSLAAVEKTLDLARASDAEVLLLHVVEMPALPAELPPEIDLASLAVRMAGEARRRLNDLVPAADRHRCTIETPIVDGRAYREILRTAAERQADLVVMGVHGRGAVDLMLFGSTTHHVLRVAALPVLVVHSENGAAALRGYRQGERARLAAGSVPSSTPPAHVNHP